MVIEQISLITINQIYCCVTFGLTLLTKVSRTSYCHLIHNQSVIGFDLKLYNGVKAQQSVITLNVMC